MVHSVIEYLLIVVKNGEVREVTTTMSPDKLKVMVLDWDLLDRQPDTLYTQVWPTKSTLQAIQSRLMDSDKQLQKRKEAISADLRGSGSKDTTPPLKTPENSAMSLSEHFSDLVATLTGLAVQDINGSKITNWGELLELLRTHSIFLTMEWAKQADEQYLTSMLKILLVDVLKGLVQLELSSALENLKAELDKSND